MKTSEIGRRAIVQDTLTGEIIAVGWVSGDQQARIRTSGRVSLSPKEDSEPVPTEESWPIVSSQMLGTDWMLLGTVAPKGNDAGSGVLPFLLQLEATLDQRRSSSSAAKSYTRALLEGGAPKIGAKLREEADELARALADEADERVLSEAADVIYHLLVGLCSRRLPLRHVIEVLLKRTGQSGHEEKASRR